MQRRLGKRTYRSCTVSEEHSMTQRGTVSFRPPQLNQPFTPTKVAYPATYASFRAFQNFIHPQSHTSSKCLIPVHQFGVPECSLELPKSLHIRPQARLQQHWVVVQAADFGSTHR